MIEKVKKILKSEMALERCDPDVMPYFTDFYWIPVDQITDFAQQICRLIEPKPDICKGCPTFYEGCEGSNQEDCARRPRPDEGRLLTDEEIDALDAEFSMEELGSHAHEDKLLKAQRDLTASINDAEIRKLILEYEFALENKDAECQARVEKIFEEGGSLCPHRKPYSLKRRCFTCWQALKKKELK